MNNYDYLKELGKKIRAVRQSKGVSLKKLSEMCGTDFSNLSHIENARKNPRILTLKGIADVLGMDVKEFL